MKKLLQLCISGIIFLFAGCVSVEMEDPDCPRIKLENRWSQKDEFQENRRPEVTLPLSPLGAHNKIKISENMELEIRGSRPKKYSEKLRRYKKLEKNDKDVFPVVKEILVGMILDDMKSSLNEKYVASGLDLLKMSPVRNPDFAKSDSDLLMKARGGSLEKEDSAIIIFYDTRYKLHQEIHRYLKSCGLSKEDIYRFSLFTYLEIELLGIEQEYKTLFKKYKESLNEER